MSEWKRYKLGELLRVKHGWAFKGEFFSDTGVQSILTPGNFYESGGFRANPLKDRFYSGDYPKEYLCSKGDLVVAMTEQAAGLLGSTAIVPEDNRYLHNQRIGLISCNESLNKDFAYYLFMTQSVRQQISRSASGTKVKHTSPEKIYDVQVDIPKIQTQKNIAFFLSSLDKKIQINNQINQELEAMAKTLYDYWFVQFDFPDQNGKPYKSSGGKMIYNPELKREIPEGWGVEKLGDVAYLKAGGDKPSNISEIQSKETPFPIYSNGLDNKGLYGYTNKATIHKKSLTVSARGTIGYVQRRFSSFFPIIRLISVTPKEEKMIGYIENFLKSIQFENSGSVQRQLTVPQIDKLYILVPKNEVLKKYHSMTINYYFEVENNEQQNQELIQLRDWLLPMLMNGQVKVE